MLNLSELKILSRSLHPTEKAAVIHSHFKNRIIIKNEQIYTYDDALNVYTVDRFKEKSLIIRMSVLIDTSYKSLTSEEREELKEGHEKTYPKIFKNDDISTYSPQLMELLSDKNIAFDTYKCQVHFKNGYYDLNDNAFKQREHGKHFITRYIDRNYTKSNRIDREKVKSILSKIITNKDDLKTILLTFGSALSGLSIEDQDILILIGKGSAGKSTMLIMTKYAMPVYFKELKDDAFAKSNTKIDKIINSYVEEPLIRITCIIEPKDSFLDDSLM
jgi:hypothetical protein